MPTCRFLPTSWHCLRTGGRSSWSPTPRRRTTTCSGPTTAGLLGPEILDRKDDEGLSVADWLRRYGQDPTHLTDARISPGALAGFLELHIEQDPNLDEAKVPIGVVQGIVDLKRFQCVTTGLANHAGTTPMDRRRDALAAAAKDAVREVVNGEVGRQVGTVGYVRAEPGAVNVISGRAEFPVELRDLDASKIDRMWERIRERFQRIDSEEGVATECTLLDTPASSGSVDGQASTVILRELTGKE